MSIVFPMVKKIVGSTMAEMIVISVGDKIAAETLDTELIQASEKFLKSCIFLIFLFTYPPQLDLAIEVQKHQRRCDYRYEEPDFSRHAGY